MKTEKYILIYLLVSLWILSMVRCANPVSPSGGPKDILPPVVIGSLPANYSTGFLGDKVEIDFDEFIKLNDPASQILISPPVLEKPEYRLRGKKLIIRFAGPLKDSTTYNIFFGNSIADLNEGNTLENYQYVFSTGNQIDSLSIRGHVLNAFDLVAAEDVFVMLYIDDNDTIPFDSLPYLTVPYYVSRTNKSGSFELNNLRNQEYKIFAVKDINSNFLFDLPNEEIAFLDSLLIPEYFKPVSDTTSLDSLIQEGLAGDSLIVADTTLFTETLADSLTLEEEAHNYYDLYLFQQIDSTQKISDAVLAAKKKILFAFKYPTKKARIEVINYDFGDTLWFLQEINTTRDSIVYWLVHPTQDTLDFVIIQQDTMILDTVQIVVKDDDKKKKKQQEQEPNYIKIKSNTAGSKLDLNKDLILSFPYPIKDYQLIGMWLIEQEDTLFTQPYFIDSVRRKLIVPYDWKEETSYKLFFPDSVFTDILDRSNDSTFITFSTRSMGDYGIIILDFEPQFYCTNFIIQLLSKDQKLLRQQNIKTPGQVRFDYLKPGEYQIKTICDSNGNGRWDTGNYGLKLQPETVWFFPKLINVRANWEIEEKWIIDKR